MSRRYRPPACIVCATTWPEPGCCWSEYGWVTCHPTCTDILDAHLRDYTFGTRGRWRSKAEVLRSLRGEAPPPRRTPLECVITTTAPTALVIPAWVIGREHRIIAGFCPWCLTWHTHGWPLASGPVQHRVAHCWLPGGPGAYHLVVMGELTHADIRWVRAVYAPQLGANRRRILRARGARHSHRLWWPDPPKPAPWDRRRKRGRRG